MNRTQITKVLIFLAALVPLGRLAWKAFHDGLGANPIEVITHSTGDWTLILILTTLSITPLRKLTRQYWLIGVRRTIGLFAFFYGVLHFTTYIWLDKFFDWHEIIKDVAKRPFITIGFSAFVLLIPLAITSTAGWIPPRRQELAAPAQTDLCDGCPGSDSLHLAGQGRQAQAPAIRVRAGCFVALPGGDVGPRNAQEDSAAICPPAASGSYRSLKEPNFQSVPARNFLPQPGFKAS